MINAAKAVKTQMQKSVLALPSELSVSIIYDASDYVSRELNKIYWRTSICVLILLCFVYLVSRDVKYLIIILATLIVNILVAVIFYYILHLSIHIYTLAGITVSLGIIIDTSIIMIDHYSYYKDKRIIPAIISALLTTIGALGIVWLLPEDQQINLEDFSLVVYMIATHYRIYIMKDFLCSGFYLRELRICYSCIDISMCRDYILYLRAILRLLKRKRMHKHTLIWNGITDTIKKSQLPMGNNQLLKDLCCFEIK